MARGKHSIEFTPLPGVKYLHDYDAIFKDLKSSPTKDKIAKYRYLCKNDSFFLLHFVLGYAGTNHPFVVQACRDVDEGPDDYTLDLWARGHYKSSIITTCGVLKILLNDPEARVCILSHTRPTAKSFLRNLKMILTTNERLKTWFPDILWANPESEAPKWSEDDGLFVKRDGYYPEASIEAYGLVEGMPVGKHYTHRLYDDIETRDLIYSGDMIQKLKESFALSMYLKSTNGKHRVVGTPYSHLGLLNDLRNRITSDGQNIYHVRVKPATDNGLPNGTPVLISQKELDNLKTDELTFHAQYLLNPTPITVVKLQSKYVEEVLPEQVPPDLMVFMVVDPAGDLASAKGNKNDSWAILTLGVNPDVDQLGQSNVYLLNAFISPMTESEGIEQIVRQYQSSGIVLTLGIEKAGMSTTHNHVLSALKQKGRHLSEEAGSFTLLRSAGRNKTKFIESSLSWPLNNGKLKMLSTIPSAMKSRIRMEMDLFPYWHDDGLNAWAYLYDILADDRFRYRYGYGRKLSDLEVPELGVI